MQKATRVILVRHGRSSFNDQGRYQGSSNESVLTQTGIETARLVGQHLKERSIDTPIDLIYASPLRRVQQTAREIARMMAPGHSSSHTLPYTASTQPLPIVISHDLKEISLSLWEGFTYDQVKQRFPSQYRCWQQRPHEFELPTSEHRSEESGIAVTTKTYFPVQDLYRDAYQFWAKLLPWHVGKTILIVSHSGTIHALLSTALGISPTYHHSLQQSNCGISELTFSELSSEEALSKTSLSEQRIQLHQLNQTTAIGETLPKLKVNKKGIRLLLVSDNSLTDSGSDRLRDRLSAVPIDFCLSADKGQAWLKTLTEPTSQMLCLKAQKADFLQSWQQYLHQSYQPPSSRTTERFMTGLVVAPRSNIQQLIMQTLGGQSRESDAITLRQGYFSVIHYPYDHRPVVQAINT